MNQYTMHDPDLETVNKQIYSFRHTYKKVIEMNQNIFKI